MASAAAAAPPPTTNAPATVRDPRFRAARALVAAGRAEAAVGTLATLLRLAVAAHGAAHPAAAPLYHEYGNALFRAYLHEEARRQEAGGEEEEQEEDGVAAEGGSEPLTAEQKRHAAAAAAEKRLPSQPSSSQPLETPASDAAPVAPKRDGSVSDRAAASAAEDDDEGSDLELALEMLETAWAIYDQHTESASIATDPYRDFVQEQLPRVLSHLGEVLAELHRHADAVDAYLRALRLHEELLQRAQEPGGAATAESLRVLQCRRKVVEDNVLVAETLLACPNDGPLTTSETRTVLVPAGERVAVARGYYDAAQRQLEETVVCMGQLVAKNVDLGEEKENVCFASTMLMGVGLTLSELDEIEAEKSMAPSKKKAKTT